jgi:DNA repair exonuclease SbcCD nuclease subunit
MPAFTHIVQIGDLYDFYNLSRYPRSLNIDKPAEEIHKARECAVEMWIKLQEIFPKAYCYQIIGNHDERLKKSVMSKLPELYDVVDMSHLWDFRNVKTQNSQREELIIKDIVFLHGHYSRPGTHMNHNMANTAFGHTHKGSCVFRKLKDKILWEINAATMADLTSIPLSYTAQRQFSNMMNGFSVVDEFGPRFIPLLEGKLWQKN